MERGKLIVVEGIDSSGKGSQKKALDRVVSGFGLKTETYDFPQYKTTLLGPLLERMLYQKEFGDLNEINPYFAAPWYALDRFEVKPKIRLAIRQGKIVICDRYVPSNFHQAAKLPAGQVREEFVNWFETLEYDLLELPREDAVVFLDVLPEYARELAIQRLGSSEESHKRVGLDIAETNFAHQKASAEVYRDIASRRPHWLRIDCMVNENKMKEEPQITYEIVNSLRRQKVLPR